MQVDEPPTGSSKRSTFAVVPCRSGESSVILTVPPSALPALRVRRGYKEHALAAAFLALPVEVDTRTGLVVDEHKVELLKVGDDKVQQRRLDLLKTSVGGGALWVAIPEKRGDGGRG